MPRFPLKIVYGAFLLTAASATAFAADLPVPPAYPPQAYVPVASPFSWTGFYIGGNAGYGWNHGSGTFTTATGSGPFSTSGNSFLGGAEAGFNWQSGWLVLGMETDFQGITGSEPVNAIVGGTAIAATAKTPWFGTFRGRVGFAFDRFMIYGSAGGVYGDATLNGTSGATSFSSSATYVSWTAGGGVEWAFWGPLSAKVEYLYIGSPSVIPSVPGVTSASGSASANIIRAGLNYHF